MKIISYNEHSVVYARHASRLTFYRNPETSDATRALKTVLKENSYVQQVIYYPFPWAKISIKNIISVVNKAAGCHAGRHSRSEPRRHRTRRKSRILRSFCSLLSQTCHLPFNSMHLAFISICAGVWEANRCLIKLDIARVSILDSSDLSCDRLKNYR